MGWKESELAINGELGAAFKRVGVGAITRAEESMKVYKGFLRKARHSGNLRVRTLVQILDVLGIEPQRFFAQAFPSEGDPRDWAVEFHHDANRLALVHPEGRIFRGIQDWKMSPLTAEQTAEVKRLDGLKYDQPQAAGQQAAELCQKAVEARQLLLALQAAGVWGSCLVLENYLRKAKAILGIAMELAQQHRLRPIRAGLILRAIHIVACQEKFTQGISMTEVAIIEYVSANDWVGISKALTLRGNMALYLRRHKLALESFSIALERLPKSGEEAFYFTALSGLVIGNFQGGNIALAQDYVAQVDEYIRQRGLDWRICRARLDWYKAWIAVKQERYLDAELHYRAVIQSCHGFPFEVILASIELAYLLLVTSRVDEATNVVLSLLKFSFALEGKPVVDRALMGLIHAARLGKLSLGLVQGTRAKFERLHSPFDPLVMMR